MRKKISLFLLLFAHFVAALAQGGKAGDAGKVPIAIALRVNEKSPVAGNQIEVTLEITPLVAVKSAKAVFTAAGNLALRGRPEFAVGALAPNAKRLFTATARLTGNGRAILTGSFEMVTPEGYTLGTSKSLYFLVNPGNTFYAEGSFVAAQRDSVTQTIGPASSGGANRDEARKKALQKGTNETVPFDTAPPKPDGPKKNGPAAAAASITISGTILWTDRDSVTHPVKFAPVQVWNEDVAPDALLKTATTDDKGFYSVDVEVPATDAPDIYLKVLAKSAYFFIVPPNDRGNEDMTYSVTSPVKADLSASATLSLTVLNNKNGLPNEAYNSFSVHGALIESAQYLQSLTGSAPAKLPVEFPVPGTASFFQRAGSYLGILFVDRYDWDVLHHEYGHFVQHTYSIADLSASDGHDPDDHLADRYPKGKGIKLAWNEAWPSYFGISLQQDRGTNIAGVGAGNSLYEDTEDSPTPLVWNIETGPPYPSIGEDNEIAVQRVLWDLYDGNADANDDLALGGNALWQLVNANKPLTLSDAWKAFTNGKPLAETVKYGSIFAEHKVASLPKAPADGTKLDKLDQKVTFTWDANGAGPSNKHNRFKVKFYNAGLTTLLFESGELNDPKFEAAPADLKKIFAKESEVKWLVESRSNTNAPETGPYTSPAFTLKGDPEGVDIAFVIDDTGSMGEEIDGVKNALLRVLDSYKDDTSGTVFQLVSYKDNVTVREPTTDLALIQSQVASLFASGGGDCPEASIEAMEAIIGNVKEDGIIFHATDASPHPGVSLDGVLAAAKAKSIAISTLLSGNCSSSFTLVAGAPAPGQEGPYSDNKDPQGGTGSAPTAGVAAAAELTAIEAFSLLSRETGGLFAFVPEVNTGIPSEVQRYENIAFNLTIGGLTLSISSVEPSKGPVGGKLLVTVNGARTHFNDSTRVVFEGGDVTASGVKVISPTRLEVTLTVAPEATPGFKNITVTTVLAGDTTETAEGAGVFEVTAAPSTPTVLSIVPAAGAAGQKLTVTVSGINTNFSDDSKLNLGSGISVLRVDAISKQLLEADIQISPAAETGFRNVVVETGSEVATENVIGPFLVTLGAVDTLQAVTSFTLVNADTDEDIRALQDNDTLNLAALATLRLNIRANTAPDTVGSVLFDLDGEVNVENNKPYAYAANAKSDYFAWTPAPGDHVLTATPYSERTPYDAEVGNGEKGTPLSIRFHVIHQAVTGFTLINADTDQPIMAIKEGDVIDLGKLPTQHLNIRAHTTPGRVGSVVMDLDGKAATENNAPYAYAGNRGDDYFAMVLAVGDHQLTATPYSAQAGAGLKGKTLSVQFKVTGLAVNELVLLNADTDQDVQTLKDGDVLDLAALPTRSLNIRAATNPAQVGSVSFHLDNRVVARENQAPYAVGGDLNGDFRPWALPLGKHTLTVSPFEGAGASGKKGASYALTFTVVDGASASGRLAYPPHEVGAAGILASPNPFSGTTRIRFVAPESGNATLEVFTMQGRRVAGLFNAYAEGGKAYDVAFSGGPLPGGVYITKLTVNRQALHYKLVLTK